MNQTQSLCIPFDSKFMIKSNNLIKKIKLKSYFINGIDINSLSPQTNVLILKLDNISNNKYGELHPLNIQIENISSEIEGNLENSLIIPYLQSDIVKFNRDYIDFTLFSTKIPKLCSNNEDGFIGKFHIYAANFANNEVQKIKYKNIRITLDIRLENIQI